MARKSSGIEMMKFDPPIKSRFLPGEVYPSEEKRDLEFYKMHRLNCAKKKTVIDNKPPKFNLTVYYNRFKIQKDGKFALINYNQNLQIAKKINTVVRMGGKVNCWNLNCWNLKIEKNESAKKKKKQKLLYEQIMKYNKVLYDKLDSLKSTYGEYSPRVLGENWKIWKADIELRSRFPWFKNTSPYPSISANAIRPSVKNPAPRTRCFFDLELSEQGNLQLGRIVFELYTDYVPLICANFEAFCRGHNGLCYKGTPIHRIMTAHWCQGGDVTKFNGIGGASIYENEIADENYSLQHNCPGVLSTCGDKGTFDSKFNMTFRPLTTMDGKRIVFGKVVKGLQNLLKIRAYGTTFGKPVEKVIVSNCGVLPRKETKRHSDKLQSFQSKTLEDECKALLDK